MARVSHFYGMNYPAVLAMPLKAFWAFNRNIDRLRAEADQRLLNLLCSSQAPEAAKSLGEKLASELGKPVVVLKGFDGSMFKKLQEQVNASKAHGE